MQIVTTMLGAGMFYLALGPQAGLIAAVVLALFNFALVSFGKAVDKPKIESWSPLLGLLQNPVANASKLTGEWQNHKVSLLLSRTKNGELTYLLTMQAGGKSRSWTWQKSDFAAKNFFTDEASLQRDSGVEKLLRDYEAAYPDRRPSVGATAEGTLDYTIMRPGSADQDADRLSMMPSPERLQSELALLLSLAVANAKS